MKDEFLGNYQKAEQMFGPIIDFSTSLTNIDVSNVQINCCKPGPGSTLWCQLLAASSVDQTQGGHLFHVTSIQHVVMSSIVSDVT